MTLLGKQNQTLLGHVTDCLTSMDARIEYDKPVLKAVCAERLGTSWDDVAACLRYAAVMHDIGKATDKWQDEQEKRIATNGSNSLITHALPSAFMTMAALQLKSPVNTPQHAMTLAIWGHHGQLSDDSGIRATNRPVKLLDEGWQQLGALAAKVSGFKQRDFPTNQSFQIGDQMGKRLCEMKKQVPPYRRDEALQFKGLYCLMASLLRNCDGAASSYAGQMPASQASAANPGGAFLLRADDVPNLYDWKQIIQTDVLKGCSPNNLQRRLHELSGLSDLLNAGCGEGKTAFALRHAQELMQQGKINRVIFTLPTKFTSNNMHKDFRHLYGLPTSMVGLFHGDSRQFLKREYEQSKEAQEDEVENANLIIQEWQMQDRVYHRPVTISTIDHLLLSLYHGYKYADWAFGNILQSLVVFDELHHYETQTMKAINEALAVLRLLRIPHLIMTATIPKTRIDTFNSRQPGDPQDRYKPLVSEGREETPVTGSSLGKPKESFVFRKVPVAMVQTVREKEQTRYDVSPALLDSLEQYRHLKQIVFVNQVEKAKAVARAIAGKKLSVICYHAEFIGRDRNTKETEIRAVFKGDQPCILVATQIAELSLDISADRMHSEIAPLDDLVQRGGRLHRNGISPVRDDGLAYEMLVYPLNFESEADVLPYVKLKQHLVEKPLGTSHLLQRSWEILPEDPKDALYSFENVRKWVNTLYDQSEPLIYSAFRTAMQEDTVFGSRPQDRYSETGEEGNGQIVLRAKEYETFDIVPEQFVTDLTDDHEKNRDFQLKINQFKFWKANRAGFVAEHFQSVLTFNRGNRKMEHESKRFCALKRNYSYDYGIDFRGEQEFDTEEAEMMPVKIGSNFL